MNSKIACLFCSMLMIVNVFGPAAQNFGPPDPCSEGGSADSLWGQKLYSVGIPTQITPPVANAGPDQTLFENEVVYFNGSGSTGNITSYEWDFDVMFDSDGDGEPANDVDATGMTPNHTYEDHGEYKVKLTVNTTYVENVTADQDVVFIVDRSGSISEEELDLAKSALKNYTYEMRDPDTGAVVHFSSDSVLMHHLTDNYGALRTDIDNIPDPMGGTVMGPAIHKASDELINYSQEEHISVEILFSDGVPSDYQDALDEAEFAEENNIVIHTVGLDIAPDSQAEELMITIADITGGNYYNATGAENLSKIYMEISKDVKESIFVDSDVCVVTLLHVNQPPLADAGEDQTVNLTEIVEVDGSGSYDPDDFWNTITVNTSDSVGTFTSMVLDSHDYPHIIYRDDIDVALKYASWNGSSWEIRTVESYDSIYGFFSIALDKNDYPHISYHSGYPDYNLKYARWDGSTWHKSTVDTRRNAGYYNSIAVDSLGNPHIGYQLRSPYYALMYARWDGSSWYQEILNESGNIQGSISIALDENDYAHLCYYDGYPSYNLRYTYWTGSNWSDEAVVSTEYVTSYSSMALDGNGYAHISYSTYYTGYIIKYTAWNGSAWTNITVDNSTNLGYLPSIALDSDNKPHISYYKSYPKYEMKYAEWTESGWNIETVDDEDYVGYYTSIKIDSIDRPHIGYCDWANRDLKYAWVDDVIVSYDWEFETSSPHGSGKRVNHSFSTLGKYEVTLKVTDTHGLTGYDTCNITIVSSGAPPVADAGSDQTVNEGDVVLLNGSFSYSSRGPMEIYEWDFESDGIYDYQESPSNAPDGAFDGKTTHVYGDDGIYIVTLRITDTTGANDTDTCNITMNNLDPEIEPLGPFTIFEGLPLVITVSSSDPGSDDLTFTCNWGDGTPDTVMTDYNDDRPGPEPVYDPVINEIKSPWGNYPFNVTNPQSHTYGDNGEFNITLTVEDDDGGTTTSATTVTVYNVEPALDSITAPPGSESSLITFTSAATDIGTDDLTFTWNWGDGTPQTTAIYYNDGSGPDPLPSPLGTYPFTATDTKTHTYGDDGVYTITLTVEDDDEGMDFITTDVVIQNVAPTITLVIAPSGDEGSELIFSADATDPGSDDLEFTWDFEYGPTITNVHYNDGTNPDPLKSPWGTFPFSASDTVSHNYGDNYGYTLTLTVTDDDGGTTIYTTTVTIDNVAPSITQIVFPSSIDEGSPSTYQATSVDPGSDDLTFSWEFELGAIVTNSYYNDGVGPDPYPSPAGTFPFQSTDSAIHTYGDNGAYNITLSVEDDDGGTTTYTTTITVNNVAPTIEPLGPFDIDEGSPLDISAISTDPGTDDLTFTWEFEFNPANSNVHYNDGATPDPPTSPWGTFPFSATDLVSTIYGDNGVYNIILTVEDDDGGTATFTTNITVNNVAPTIEPLGHFTVDECSLLELIATSTDPGSDDLTFTWEIEMGPTIINIHNNDGFNPDPLPSPWGTHPYSISDSVDHIYGDNGIYSVTLTVSDDDGGVASHTTNITVNNVGPEIVSIEAYMYANITLRVAGEKYHSVGVHLYEEGTEIWTAMVTRHPGSPDKQAATICGLRIDMTKSYSATVDYRPNDPQINGNVWGANPVWIDITFENGSVKRLHHTFNVRQSDWDSDHWNHIDPWEVDLNVHLVGCAFEIASHITDPGSDDIFLTYTYGSQIVNVSCLNNPPILDPHPSPEVKPVDIHETAFLAYEGPGTIILTVTDDDGGSVFQVINLL